MKKLLSLVLAAFMLIMFAGCKKSNNQESVEEKSTEELVVGLWKVADSSKYRSVYPEGEYLWLSEDGTWGEEENKIYGTGAVYYVSSNKKQNFMTFDAPKLVTTQFVLTVDESTLTLQYGKYEPYEYVRVK